MQRKKRRPRAQPNAPAPLTVTVCVSPLRRVGRNTVDRELRQVRSALLYADRVRLVSTTVAMLETLRPLRSISTSDPWDDIRRLPDETLRRAFDTKSVKSVRKDLARLTQLRRDDHQRTALEAALLPELNRALSSARDLYDEARTPELDLARERGALEIEIEHFELDDPSAAHTAWFRGQLLSAWRDPTGTVLLDQRAQRVLRTSTSADTSEHLAMSRSKRAATGTGMVKQLPAFPSAQMSDLLEVREDLSDERAAYRAVVRDLSARLASAALDEALSSEIEELWGDTVAPVLNRMEDKVRLSRLASGVAKRTFGDALAALKTGTVTVAVTELWAAGAASHSAIASSAYVLGTALEEAVEVRKASQAHEFVYLANLERGLSRRR